MAMRRVLDTNIILYLLGGKLAEPLEPAEYYISVITELELLSYPHLSNEEEQQIRSFLDDVTLVGLNEEIRESAIQFRREHHLKLPDAIICATAFVLDASLLSNDTGLHNIPSFEVVSLPLVTS